MLSKHPAYMAMIKKNSLKWQNYVTELRHKQTREHLTHRNAQKIIW